MTDIDFLDTLVCIEIGVVIGVVIVAFLLIIFFWLVNR